MDDQNLKQVQIACPPNHQHKLHMLAEFCSREGVREIPDPYYGGIAAFELALDLIEDACSNLVVRLMNQIATQGSSL
jgi:protein-tyrosine phosphatase